MGKTYRSMLEIEKEFYPRDYEKRLSIAQKIMKEIKPELERILKDYQN